MFLILLLLLVEEEEAFVDKFDNIKLFIELCFDLVILLSNEEIIIPLTIDRNPTSNSYALTHKKRHKHPRTHKTHKIYKHSISSKHKNKHHNKKKSKSSKLISRASTKRSKNYLSTFF